MSTEIETLRAVIEDETKPMQVRKAAAEHVIRLAIEQVEATAIPADDPEVLALRKPANTEGLPQVFADVLSKVPTQEEATAKVAERRKLRTMLAVVVDTGAHQLERLAACAKVLADHPHIGMWKANGYTAERLLNGVLPANALKRDARSMWHGPVSVARPPLVLADVWRL